MIGIGIGIIIGALLLALFDLGEKSQQQLKEIEQQINDPVVSPEPTASPEQESSQSPEVTTVPEPNASAPISPSEPTTAEEPNSPVKPNSPLENEQELQSVPSAQPAEEADAPKVSYILRVYPGDTISKTGKQLAEHQIIEDVEQFVTFFKSHDATIRAGYFLVEEGKSLEELLQLFAGQPLTESEANGQIKEKEIEFIH